MTAPTMIGRRELLRRVGLGAGTVAVIGAGGLAYRAYDQGVLEVGQGAAYQPWNDWQDGTGTRRRWSAPPSSPRARTTPRVGSSPPGAATSTSSPTCGRGTGALDPFLRELHVGLGAAIENVVLTGRALGLAPTVLLLPSGSTSNHVAHVAVADGPRQPSDLAAQIPHRHTNRYPFATGTDVPPAALDAMDHLADPNRARGATDLADRLSPRPDERAARRRHGGDRGRSGPAGERRPLVPTAVGRHPTPTRRRHDRHGRPSRSHGDARQAAAGPIATGGRRRLARRHPRPTDPHRRGLRHRRRPRCAGPGPATRRWSTAPTGAPLGDRSGPGPAPHEPGDRAGRPGSRSSASHRSSATLSATSFHRAGRRCRPSGSATRPVSRDAARAARSRR